LARWIVLLLAGYVAASARSKRWWETPLAIAFGAVAAELLASVVGIVTGEFLARGMGPGLVLVLPVWAALGGLIAGLVAAAVRTLVERRATAV
jgi:membrane associated rhomboid family serine protease